MDNRRAFLKKAALLAGGVTLWESLPLAIQRAMAINPAVGTTYLDAEHIVFLMQENRSFDHTFGALQGVRGFSDPRAITLPGGNPVWLQSDDKGQTYCPFRLNIHDTKATWMSSLPHSYESQVDARNEGRMNQWLEAKKGDYPELPMTLGYYTREDIPFYYALADAFTICDQHFCSSLTGTSPNRLHFWTGTIRPEQDGKTCANVRNEEVDYGVWASWKTYPERLESAGVSWKVYQNEIGLDSGLQGEEDPWLSNFTDNPLEYFTQYNVRFSPTHIEWLKEMTGQLLDIPDKTPEQQKQWEEMTQILQQYTPEAYARLSETERNLHEKAFDTNRKDPDYRKLTTLTYQDNGTERTVDIPKGDILHQFREDVDQNKLASVSWLVAPEHFSDHPTSAWYGAWYVSEVFDILTKNPEVWKKTIFILTYDENDGCFDHIPPFVAPNPRRTDTGKASAGIDTSLEYVPLEQDRQRSKHPRESPIGLGYRVPFIVASPWSRGGWVNSQVFDHTSNLQFLEHFIATKWNKQVRETNISAWRRTITGDLTSIFRPYNGEALTQPTVLNRDEVIESIHKSQFLGLPNPRPLTPGSSATPGSGAAAAPGAATTHGSNATTAANAPTTPLSAFHSPQERGTRPSSSLPYELYVDGKLDKSGNTFTLQFTASKDLFHDKAVGAPFNVYAPGKYAQHQVKAWSYAVAAGDTLTDTYPLSAFDQGNYHLRAYGPNGFFREFKGNTNDPSLAIQGKYDQGNFSIAFRPIGPPVRHDVQIIDNGYGKNNQQFSITADEQTHSASPFVLDLESQQGWYDVSVRIKGYDNFEIRYAGRVETGMHSITDPHMGGTV